MAYRRYPSKQPKNWKRWTAIAICIVAIGFYYKDCTKVKSEFKPIAIDRDGYRADELALLQITTENILNLEKEKNYGQIYDQYASIGLKNITPRRDFLLMGNCAQQTLGSLLYYNREENNFKRSQQDKYTYDTISKTVSRIEGNLQEKMVFIREGFDYRLHGFYWLTPHRELANCIEAALKPPVAPKKAIEEKELSKTKATSLPVKPTSH